MVMPCPQCGAPVLGGGCPRCTYRKPKEAPKGRELPLVYTAPGGEPGSSTTPVLQETLLATGARSSNLVVISGGVSEAANTAAGTHDGSDSTADQLQVAGDSVDIGQGTLEVLYTVTTSVFSGTIDFVRIICRAQVTDPQGSGVIIGDIGTNTFGVAVPLTNAYASYTLETDVDPGDGLPWTTAKINSYQWGFLITAQSGDPNDASDSEVTEMRVEVWGH